MSNTGTGMLLGAALAAIERRVTATTALLATVALVFGGGQ